ncbi:MAG: hypothetical protein JWQ11_2741 [Rhizobacter sp.]|nr:hypothetical protein [Rhizobacter sp.]
MKPFSDRSLRQRFPGRIVSHMAACGTLGFALCMAVSQARADDVAADTKAATPAASASPFGPAFVQVTESTLDGMRGGFTTDAGVQVSFGIERTVLVGGNVVSTTSFNVATGGSKLPTLVSSTGALSGTSLVTAVQNSANGQKIQTLTTVDVTANSLQVLKQSNLQALVGGGVTASLQR